MAVDQDALADVVVMTVKAAMAAAVGPILERLAVAETRIAMHLPIAEKALGDLRDRVVVVETKAAAVVPLEAVPAPVVDLSPVLERVAAAEARLDVLGDLRDRVITVETKAAVPVPPDAAFYELRDRIRVVEDKAAPVFEVPVDVLGRIAALEADHTATPFNVAFRSDVDAVLERLTKAEMRLELKAAETAPILPALADLTKDIGAVRERLAVVETRAQVPGPVGKDGKDGINGLGFDDLSVVQTDERAFTMRGTRGEQVKNLGTFTFPVEIYRGVYVDGKTYERGDGVTWAGSEWHCNETTTTKPGDGSKAWTLKVKRGRDGKDGRDAEAALPVVAVGGSR